MMCCSKMEVMRRLHGSMMMCLLVWYYYIVYSLVSFSFKNTSDDLGYWDVRCIMMHPFHRWWGCGAREVHPGLLTAFETSRSLWVAQMGRCREDQQGQRASTFRPRNLESTWPSEVVLRWHLMLWGQWWKHSAFDINLEIFGLKLNPVVRLTKLEVCIFFILLHARPCFLRSKPSYCSCLDEDWLYVRTASMVRKIYIRKGMGVGAFRTLCNGLVAIRPIQWF